MKEISTKPLCFWAWNGEMDHERLREQLRELSDKGMAGVFIHSRAGLKIPYMGEAWMDAFEVAVKECERLGLQAWIYDEDGWPSGFGGGKVYAKDADYVERYLLKKELRAGEKLPNHTVATYRRKEEGFERLKVEAESVSEDCIAIYAEFNPVYVDILNPDAVRYFLEVTHERYRERFSRYFGNVIPGVFTDEPHFSPNGIPWGKYVADSFQKMHQYSVFDALPYMFEKQTGYQAYRYDFWKNISGMIRDNYAKPYYEWCEKNHLIFTGHYACEEGLVDQIAVSGGVMPLYEFQHLPGIDALGNRLVPAPVYKQAESVAWQLGDRHVLCETYACSGYDATFSDLMWIWGYQAAMGTNVPCLSIAMYSLAGSRKRDYPLFFSEQMPWWTCFPALSDGFSRINAFTTEGEKREGLLLIHPKTGIWCERGKDIEIEERTISSDFRRITEALLDLQIEFEYGDEDLLSAFAKAEGKIFRIGKRTYHTVMVPPTVSLEASTVKLLRNFSMAGGRVLFVDRLPTLIGGRPAEQKIFDFPKTMLASRTDLLRKYFIYACGPQEIELIDRYTRRPALGFVSAVRKLNNEIRILAVSRSRAEKRTVRLRAQGQVELSKENLTGSVTGLLSEYDEANDCTYAEISFDEQEVCFLTVKPVRSGAGIQRQRLSHFLSKPFLPVQVKTGDNILVIDRVRCTVNGCEEEEENTIVSTAKIFKKIDGRTQPSNLQMRYEFRIRKFPGCPMYLICEDQGVSVRLNGIKAERIGFQWDKGFGKYEISDCVQTGTNTVILERVIGPYRSKYNLDEVFQSVTNVFSYEYDIENIYISGHFDVEPVNGMTPGENCYWTNGPFQIAPYTQKQGDVDLTLQNLPFYEGTVEMSATYDWDGKKKRVWLDYDKPNFPAGKLFVNGKFAGLLGFAPYRVELTPFLKEGENDLFVELYSTSRNLYGPFHHVKGRHNYVGPSVFKGVVEFEDPVVFAELIGKKTWTERISVIPFYFSARILEEV